MESQRFDAIVVGGSIAGLMHAVVLKSLGRKVVVLESRDDSELRAEAAGLSLGPNAQKLLNKYLEIDDSFAIRTPGSQILSPTGSIVAEIPSTFSVTTCTWSLVFERLRAKFLEPGAHGSACLYMAGSRVTRLEDTSQDGLVRAVYMGMNAKAELKIEAPLVIAADGSRSTIRLLLRPAIHAAYAGYVAWRGSIPEEHTPITLNGALEGKLLFVLLEKEYIIAYLTPGPTGSTKPGERLLDWCWYCPFEAESHEFAEIMTDVKGHRHNKTVPRGHLRKEVWETQISDHKLPNGWDELIRKSEEPFVTAVTSLEEPGTQFCNGKILLVGEAFTQFRPHLGLSCDLAALQALTLGDVIEGNKTMAEYEELVTEYAGEFSVRSSAMGHFGLTGRWPEGYTPLYMKSST